MIDLSFEYPFNKGNGGNVFVINITPVNMGFLVTINASEKEDSENQCSSTTTTFQKSLRDTLRWIEDNSWPIGIHIQCVFGAPAVAGEISKFCRDTTEFVRKQYPDKQVAQR